MNIGVNTEQNDCLFHPVLVTFLSCRKGEELDFGQLQIWCQGPDSCESSCGDAIPSCQLPSCEIPSDYIFFRQALR